MKQLLKGSINSSKRSSFPYCLVSCYHYPHTFSFFKGWPVTTQGQGKLASMTSATWSYFSNMLGGENPHSELPADEHLCFFSLLYFPSPFFWLKPFSLFSKRKRTLQIFVHQVKRMKAGLLRGSSLIFFLFIMLLHSLPLCSDAQLNSQKEGFFRIQKNCLFIEERMELSQSSKIPLKMGFFVLN